MPRTVPPRAKIATDAERRRVHQLITIAEAAERLRVNPRTVRRRVADGHLTAYRVGPSLIRLDSDEVDALLRPIPAAGRAS
jgi:excisionase family DNA binding protein